MEAKHYSKTELDIRELIAEIVQATEPPSDVELWVLAASCRVRDQHAVELETVARARDVEVLILDLGNDDLPRVCILMASFPDTVRDWIVQNATSVDLATISEGLTLLATEPGFAAAKNQILGKLNSTLLGYDDARRRCKRSFLDVLSDRGRAISSFAQTIELRAPSVLRIPRTTIDDELSKWWADRTTTHANAVLLGEEGMGKTWAAIGWTSDRLEKDALPIVLPFSAFCERLESGDTIESLLPRLLQRWTEKGNSETWAKRVWKWMCGSAALQRLFLILIDGLSERPELDWRSFLRPLADRRWSDAVAVIATDRRPHWQSSCGRDALFAFEEIRVGGYTDWELQQVLTQRQITLATIPQHLLPLMRKPRYCDLVCDHFDEMKSNSDFTEERLILLDVRHRAAKKMAMPSEEALLEVVKRLASQYLNSPTLSLAMIETLLPPTFDPDRRIYREIIDGGLLVRQPGITAKFTVEPSRLVFGLGMLLADELRNLAEKTDSQIDETITSWFEPHPDMDLKVRIGGAALFHSLVEDTFPSGPRRRLLRYWLGLRNWGDEAQTAFIDYVLKCPEDFVAVAPEFWSSARNIGAAQQFLAAAFIKHRDDKRVQPLLVAAVTHWMGFVHPEGNPFFAPDAQRAARARIAIQLRAGHALEPGPLELGGENLTVVQDGALLRLSRFGLLIMSAGPRGPFIKALTSWSVASAVMGNAFEAEIADWVVRLSEEPLEQFLMTEICTLRARNTSVTEQAAQTLLWRVDPVTAARLREENPSEEYVPWQSVRKQYQADPCRTLFAWTDDDCLRCMERVDVPITQIINNLAHRVLNPDFQVPDSLIQRARGLLRFDPRAYRLSLWTTSEDDLYARALPLLASRAPSAVGDFLRAVARTIAERNYGQLHFLAFRLPDLSLLFRRVEVDSLLEAMRQIESIAKASPTTEDIGPDAWKIAQAFLLLAISPHLSSEELLSRLVRRPLESIDLRALENWFGPLSASEGTKALATLHSLADETTVVRVLWFMATAKCDLLVEDRDRIFSFAQSQSARLRAAAFRFACLSEDRDLGKRIVDFGQSFTERPDDWDVLWGAQVLIRYSSHLSFQTVSARLDVVHCGYLLHERGNKPEEAKMYGDLLNQCWNNIASAAEPNIPSLPDVDARSGEGAFGPGVLEFREQSTRKTLFKSDSATWSASRPSFSGRENFLSPETDETLNRRRREKFELLQSAWKTDAFQWFGKEFSQTALEQLCLQVPDVIKRWTSPDFVEGIVGRKMRNRVGSLLIQLCPLLLKYFPAEGLRLWRSLRDKVPCVIAFDGAYAAFRAPDNTATYEGRDQILEECPDDASISRIAYLAELYERQEWLRATITRFIEATPLWRRAKGLTLSSFSNLSISEFDAYVVQAKLGGSWMEGHIPSLRLNVENNRFAQHWFDLFLTAANPDESWGALQMLQHCGDDRFFTWRGSYEDRATRNNRVSLAFLAMQETEIKKALDRTKERRDTLFGIKIPRGEIYPFMDE